MNHLQQMQKFCLCSWTFFIRASCKHPWPVQRVINYLRWLLIETFQVLTGFTKKWGMGKLSWCFYSVQYWPVNTAQYLLTSRSSGWWCIKTAPVLGFSSVPCTSTGKAAFKRPRDSCIRQFYFYCIITLSFAHKKWVVRVLNCWWAACSSAGAFISRGNLR